MESNSNLVNGDLPAGHPLSWLINELYKVNWNPFVEHRRYITMEGHLEMFNEHEEDPEQRWKRLYFRTKDGRFQWYASHCADEHPISDILLTGADVRAIKEEWTLQVKGGKEKADLRVRVPSNVFEKWHQTLLSHSSSSLVDAYIQPVWPPVPHRTNRVLLLELGTQSIRAGILTQKPSLPHIFMPTLPTGAEAVHQPIQIAEEGTQLDGPAFVALLHTIRDGAALQAKAMDIRFRTQDYSVLLSIPQHMDIAAASQALKALLHNSIGYKNVSIVRQPSLILYSYDVTTGIVVQLGEQFSIVPVIDEFVVEEAVLSVPYGAKQIREQLRKRLDLQDSLALAGHTAAPEELLLRFLVEKTCYIATTGSSEDERGKDAVAELELGGTRVSIAVDSETRNLASEGLFKPQLWGLEAPGLHQLVHEVLPFVRLGQSDNEILIRRAVYLAGGTALLRGLAHRLERELAQLVPPSIPVQVLASPWRRHSAYLGAHLLASADEFPNCCVAETGVDDYVRRMSQTSGQT